MPLVNGKRVSHQNGRRPPSPYSQNKVRYRKVKNRQGPSLFQALSTIGIVIFVIVLGLMFLTS